MTREVPKATRDRDRAAKVAEQDYRAALSIARQIDDPWFRCQALSFAARHCPDRLTKSEILTEAFQAAEALAEPNPRVSVASWPVEVLAASNMEEQLTAKVEGLLAFISQEPSPVRRADALSLLLSALRRAPKQHFLKVLAPFTDACLSPLRSGKRNRKGESALAYWIPEISKISPIEAEALAQQIRGPVLRARALRGIERVKGADTTRAGQIAPESDNS